ncbi:LURP-one-related family protein [Clostridium sp. AL.422]|uniref:LURP-one-related/scramblase family protein n=1 Tax=Clostridium TaxID=1485 RepID=UPI00293DD41D|nr:MULTISPECIES: LURP-one-related family protein [unclassified Clostridium]MDV4152582.1 LURP-one-related family protein [Clostridium sp. AL.422]
MRKFYIKERLLSLGAKFDVYDENNIKVFVAEADKFDIGKNISIYDSTNRKILYMSQQIRLGAHKYIAYDKDMREIATIKKEFMVPEYNITGSVGVMVMESSSILGRNYEIKKAGVTIGKIDKEFTFGRDRYFLEVVDERYTEFFIGLLIMVDMVRFHNNN